MITICAMQFVCIYSLFWRTKHQNTTAMEPQYLFLLSTENKLTTLDTYLAKTKEIKTV